MTKAREELEEQIAMLKRELRRRELQLIEIREYTTDPQLRLLASPGWQPPPRIDPTRRFL